MGRHQTQSMPLTTTDLTDRIVVQMVKTNVASCKHYHSVHVNFKKKLVALTIFFFKMKTHKNKSHFPKTDMRVIILLNNDKLDNLP